MVVVLVVVVRRCAERNGLVACCTARLAGVGVTKRSKNKNKNKQEEQKQGQGPAEKRASEEDMLACRQQTLAVARLCRAEDGCAVT